MTDIVVHHLDDVYVKIECEAGLAFEMSDHFTFMVPGAQHMPKFKDKVWDGKIRLFNLMNKTIYRGLVPHIIKFAKERDYSIHLDHNLNLSEEISLEEVKVFLESLKLPHVPREYQLKALLHSIKHKRAMLISPTASGKSLIIYMILRWLLDKEYTRRVLVIVPTTGLVRQMRGDFIEYGYDPEQIQMIMEGATKDLQCPVVISTWQSIYKMPKAWFERFGAVFGDEAHTFKAKSLERIMCALTHCPTKIGTTGTLDGTKVHKLVLEGMFGPVLQVERTANLMKQGHVAKLEIRAIVLKHDEESVKRLLDKRGHDGKKRAYTYQEEMEHIVEDQKRLDFTAKLVKSLDDGNTLVLFQYVDKHGIPLYNKIREMLAGTGREVYLVHGDTGTEEREYIRIKANASKNCVIVASYGTFSTGINIKNLHYAIAASPTKSMIRLLQSIGRTLRLGDDKTSAVWYDIADDLSHKSRLNYTLKHFAERVKIYSSENLEYKVFNWKL